MRNVLINTGLILLLIGSSPASANGLKHRLGVGIQYGGIVGYQSSINSGRNNFRVSVGLSGLTLGYERHVGSRMSLGLQTFANQSLTGYGVNVNYHWNAQTEPGWVFGLDVYQAYNSAEIAIDAYFDLLFDDAIDFDAELKSGAFASVGYQF